MGDNTHQMAAFLAGCEEGLKENGVSPDAFIARMVEDPVFADKIWGVASEYCMTVFDDRFDFVIMKPGIRTTLAKGYDWFLAHPYLWSFKDLTDGILERTFGLHPEVRIVDYQYGPIGENSSFLVRTSPQSCLHGVPGDHAFMENDIVVVDYHGRRPIPFRMPR